jgi:superfamily II DNA helicase RecQ
MRNIARVILWGLPPTFCSLVQCAGRAGRELTTHGEAILIVPPGVLKDRLSEDNVVVAVENVAVDQEALNREPEEPDLINVAESLDEEGIRLRGVDASESEDEGSQAVAKLMKKRGKKKERKDTHIREVCALHDFACTKHCRRIPWDNFFENSKKCEHLELLKLERDLTNRYSALALPREHDIPTYPWYKVLRQLSAQSLYC